MEFEISFKKNENNELTHHNFIDRIYFSNDLWRHHPWEGDWRL